MKARALLWTSVVLALSPAATAQNRDTVQARELYEKGARLYNLRQFEGAVEAFERAYAISGAKAILFNIGQAHRLAGPDHCENALRAYETYLREDPGTSNAEEVQQRIGEMTACTERERNKRAANDSVARRPDAVPSASSPEGDRKPLVDPARPPSPEPVVVPSARVAPIVTTGIGAALAIAGGALYWRARVKFDEVESTCPCSPGAFSNWQTATNVSYGLLAAGGATVLGGVIWWVADRNEASKKSYGLSVDLGGVRLMGTF